MKDERKTKAQLLAELAQLRRRVTECEEAKSERKRSEEKIRQRTAQFEALRVVRPALTTELNLATLLQTIVDQAVELLEARMGAIYLYQSERDILELAVMSRNCIAGLHGTVVRHGEGLSGKVWETGLPLVVDNYQEWSEGTAVFRGILLTTVIGVPIQWGQEFLGVLNISNRPEPFSSADVELLSLFATQAAAVIGSARLISSLRESEERFRQLAENIHDVFWMTNPDGSEIFYVSPAYEKIWGRSCRSLYEQPYSSVEVIYPEDREQVVAANKWAVTRPQSREYRLVRPDGTIRWVHGRSFPVLNEQGQVYRIAGIAEDITERKQAEAALRQSEARFHSFFENSPIALVVEDFSVVKTYLDWLRDDGIEDFDLYFQQHPEVVGHCANLVRYVEINQAMLTLYQVRDKTELKILDQFFAATSLSGFKDELLAIVKSSTRFEGENLSQTITGAPIYAKVAWTVVPGYEDTYARVLVSLVDLTARKQAEEEIQQHTSQLEALQQIGLALTAELDLDTLLQTIAVRAADLLEADMGVIYLYRPEQEVLELVFISDESMIGLRGTILHRGEGLSGKVWETGRPLVIDNYQEWKGRAAVFEDMPFHTVVGVPIQWRQELLGVLNVDNHSAPFSPADMELLSLLATQAAAAIRNARLVSSLREGEERYRNLAQHNAQLYAETQQQLKEQTALREAAAVISSTLDVATVLSRIAAQMGQAIDVTSAYICSYEIELRTSTVIAEYFSCYSSPAEQVSDLGVTYYLPDDFSGALAFLQSDQPFCVHHVDNPNVPESDRRHMRQFGAQTVLLIPLEIGGEIIGYASLWESRQRREFTGAEITLCQGIAQQAAIAIENARLLEQARQDAATKAILLEEVNHRVKNNLTTIIGLLYAERRHHLNIENHASLQKVIQDLINRVQGLATVHSLLSAAEWTPLSLSELTRQIIASALQIAPYNAQIQVIVSPSPLRVTPQQANSLALVINELTTNAVKYALTKQRSAQIVVNIDCAEGMILVKYRTSGPGYPPDVLSLERHNTGMYLIQNIVSKGLQGTITLQNASGAVASIRFPALLE